MSFVTTISNPASEMARIEHKDNGVTNDGFEKTNGDSSRTVAVPMASLQRRKTEVFGATLSAHDVNYTVKVSTKLCCGEKIDKQILKNVTGVFKPGLNAIMGPSGSGKTSFLNTIADRLDKRKVKGKILVDGRPIPDNFKCMVGFVVQDDTVMGTLTVRENFAFSAALRLPSSVKKAERLDLIEDVIRELGLQHCADTKIGTPFIRGVSGGERKRCNIGMELLISPPVLFLDEPTSGLDANTANSVLLELRKLADRGRTIIFSIHQPRYSIYKLFDNLMLLSRGETVYHGPATQALDFFEKQGFKCQLHNNPPDFFLDVINADQSTLVEVSNTSAEFQDPQAMHDKITKGFRESTWNQKLQTDASAIASKYSGAGDGDHKQHSIDYATGVFNQAVVVAGRSFRDLIRNPQTGIAVVGSSIFFALMLMGIYWRLGTTPPTAFTDRGGIFFFMVMVQMFFNLGAMEIYHKEKVIYMHENVSGYYRASVYFLVKVFCDVIPLRLVAVTCMCAIVYFAAELKNEAGAFFLFVLCLFLVSLMASALCLFLAYSFQTFAAAQMLMALIYMIMMLFGGFLINIDSIGDWFSWNQYWSMVKYGIGALYINELKDRQFCSDAGVCSDGNDYLKELNIDYETDFDFWSNYLALFLLTLGLLVLAYIQLRRMKRLL